MTNLLRLGIRRKRTGVPNRRNPIEKKRKKGKKARPHPMYKETEIPLFYIRQVTCSEQ